MPVDPSYFRKIALPGTPDYYALLFAPEQAREDIRTLLACEQILDEIAVDTLERDVREAKLAWWAGELERLAESRPTHPVTRAVSEILGRFGLSHDTVLALFAATVAEARDALPATPDELLRHADARGSMVALISQVLASGMRRNPELADAITVLGRARFLSMRVFAGHHCRSPDASTQEADRQLEETQGTRLAGLARGQRADLQAALARIPAQDLPAQMPLVVMARMVDERLRLAEAGATSRMRSHLRSLVLAWRTARSASRGKLGA